MVARLLLLLGLITLAGGSAAQAPVQTRKVAITIDDGPAVGTGRNLDAFLKVANALREGFIAEKVPAIMFINERQLHVEGERDRRVEVVRQWIEAGLDLGNHTYSHPRLDNSRVSGYLDDILKGEVISRPLLEERGKKLRWFRYPFLATGNAETAGVIEDFLAQRGYRIAPVSVDYADYSYSGVYSRHLRSGAREKADDLFATVMSRLDESFTRAEKRSIEVLGYELPQILLIHCNEMNALTLRTTIQRIRKRGYTFVSLDEAMDDPAYKLPNLRPGGLGGGGLFNTLAAAKREAAPPLP
jgi:peptidoglycan/xylan/chitin deacetylase (PgdA/CDA1 family)